MRTWRSEAEAYLLIHLAALPAALGLPGAAFRMRRAAGLLPLPSKRDLLELVLPHCRGARALNPFLSDASVERLREGALLWLQLCVLEDKLTRLAGGVEDAAELPLLVQVGGQPAAVIRNAPLGLPARPRCQRRLLPTACMCCCIEQIPPLQTSEAPPAPTSPCLLPATGAASAAAVEPSAAPLLDGV